MGLTKNENKREIVQVDKSKGNELGAQVILSCVGKKDRGSLEVMMGRWGLARLMGMGMNDTMHRECRGGKR